MVDERQFHSLCIVLLVVFVSGCGAGSATPIVEAPTPPVVLSNSVGWGDVTSRSIGEGYGCNVSFGTGDERVRFGWGWSAPGALFAEDHHVGSQHFEVDYWPTAARWFSSTRLVVGGVLRASGDGVIELWDFEAHLEKPRVEVFDEDLDPPITVWTFPERIHVRRVYTSSTPGTREPTSMLPNGASSTSIFVAFADNDGDVYSLDMNTGVAEPVVSSRPGAPHQARTLTPDCMLSYGFEHVTDGYVYVLSNLDGCNLHDFKTIFLVDHARNGSIDSVTDMANMTVPNRYFEEKDQVRKL